METKNPDAHEPNAFSCPIMHQRMSNPVMSADGHSYERDAMERWIKVRTDAGEQPTSPYTGAVLDHTSLTPNHELRNTIEVSVPHEPPTRSPDPSPKRGRMKRTWSSDCTKVDHGMERAQELVDDGDVSGVLDAMCTLSHLLDRPIVRAHFFPRHLVDTLAKDGIEPIRDSLHCQQNATTERSHLVLLQALVVAELSTSELVSVDPTLDGVITVLNSAVCTLF